MQNSVSLRLLKSASADLVFECTYQLVLQNERSANDILKSATLVMTNERAHLCTNIFSEKIVFEDDVDIDGRAAIGNFRFSPLEYCDWNVRGKVYVHVALENTLSNLCELEIFT